VSLRLTRPHLFLRESSAPAFSAQLASSATAYPVACGPSWFELSAVAASERSSGKKYSEAVKWHQDGPIPAAAGNLIVKSLEPTLDAISFFRARFFGRWSSGGRIRSRRITPSSVTAKIIAWRRTSHY